MSKALALGGRFDSEQDPYLEFTDEATGERRSRKFIIGEQWSGGDEGLVHVTRLGFVHTLSIRGAAVTADGLKQLEHMPWLLKLELYGLDLSEEDLQALRQLLPHVDEFDVRRGAMLGVRGNGGRPQAEIFSVEPDSAAEKAGLQPGDIITHVDGVQVQSFTELTTEIAKYDAGDTVVLEILRAERPLKREVTFGYWK